MSQIPRGLVLALLLVALPAPIGCHERAVGSRPDASSETDSAGLPDAFMPSPDAGGDPEPCEPMPVGIGFELTTPLSPSFLPDGARQWEIAGVLESLEPPVDPFSPWDGEACFRHGDGTLSILQYRLPAGGDLPLQVGSSYGMVFRRTGTMESPIDAVVITRPTTGLHPLMFVADSGGALGPEEPLMSPLRVYPEINHHCPQEPGDCWVTIQDDLRFDSSTGGVTTDILLEQGEQGTLPVFGSDFRVWHLGAEHRVDESGICPGESRQWVFFLAWRLEG